MSKRRNNHRQPPGIPQGGQIIAAAANADMQEKARRAQIEAEILATSRELFIRYLEQTGNACQEVVNIKEAEQLIAIARESRHQAELWGCANFPELQLGERTWNSEQANAEEEGNPSGQIQAAS